MHKIPKSALQPMVDRVTDTLPAWKGQLMHHSSRLALIKSTLAAMPIYISISIGLSGWMHNALEKIMKGFIWTDTETVQNGKCMVAWGKVQRPLRLGDLGLPDPKFQGIALRLRWL
jgi:hypothetical protein